MGFWSRLKNNSEQLEQLKQRDVYSIADPAFASVLGLTSYTGEIVNECRALNISAMYRAVSLVAGSIGTLPLRSIQTSANGIKTKKPSWLDNPYAPINDDDFYQGTQYEWVETLVAHLVLHGNAFLWLHRDGAGQVQGAYPIHPSFVKVEVDKDAPGERLYHVHQDNGGELVVGINEVLHIPGLSFDGIRGYSLVELARNSLGIALAGEKSAGTVMKNGPQHTVLITPNDDLKEEEADTIVTSVQGAMAGADNAGKMVLINRALTLSPFTMTYADAQFLETRVFQIEEISRWTGVPPHLLGLTEKQSSWGQGVKEQNLGLSRYVLNTYTTRIEQRLTRLLGPKVEAEFDYSGFFRPAPEDEITSVIAQMNGGLLTPNEARAIRNLPPVEGGDVLRTPAGQTPPTEGADMNATENSQPTE